MKNDVSLMSIKLSLKRMFGLDKNLHNGQISQDQTDELIQTYKNSLDQYKEIFNSNCEDAFKIKGVLTNEELSSYVKNNGNYKLIFFLHLDVYVITDHLNLYVKTFKDNSLDKSFNSVTCTIPRNKSTVSILTDVAEFIKSTYPYKKFKRVMSEEDLLKVIADYEFKGSCKYNQ